MEMTAVSFVEEMRTAPLHRSPREHLLAFAVGLVLLALSWLYLAITHRALEPWERDLFTAVKLPLILLLTATGNALLNGILAPLLGLNLSLRQSFDAILLSFAIAGAILAAFSPLVLFEVWNLPAMDQAGFDRGATFNRIQLTQVAAIAFAGIAATARLLRYLESCSGSQGIARRDRKSTRLNSSH